MATAFRVCARRLCLVVVPVCGARSAGSGCGACGRRRGLAGLRDRPLRAKLVCGDLAGGPPPTGATGRIKWAGCGGWRAVRGLRGLVVVPVGGGGSWPDHSQRREGGVRPARPAGPGCGACGRWRGLAGPLPATRGRREACGAWPGFETTRRAKLVARAASGRAGLAPHGGLAAGGRTEVWRQEDAGS